MFMITPMPCVPLKPGSGGRPFPGLIMDVVNEDGESVKANEEGFLIIKRPWPSMMRTIYNDPERYVNQYWSRYPGYYLTGDSARRDEDGLLDHRPRRHVIKVSGYRLGTAEIESALVSHTSVAEAAAIGLPHEVKGNAIHCFVILKEGVEATPQLGEELRKHVGHEVGPIARPENIEFVSSLPKTRSGKIMRRVLKAKALGVDPGNLNTWGVRNAAQTTSSGKKRGFRPPLFCLRRVEKNKKSVTGIRFGPIRRSGIYRGRILSAPWGT